MNTRSRIMTTSLVAVALVLFACTQGMGGVIFSVDHNNLPAVGDPVTTWDGFAQRGGSPTVVDFGGEKWMENLRDTSDRLRHDSGGHGTTPIPITGATIVTAIKPTRHASGNPWTSIVDVFYDQLCIGVMNETGQIKVKISGANAANPIWTSSSTLPEEPGVLSLSVESGANPAFEVFWRGENDAAAISMGTGNGNTAGQPYTALYPSANSRGYAQYINLGGNDPDPWPTYNGLIGDTIVYDEQLSAGALLAAQDQVRAAMSIGGAAGPPPAGPIDPSGFTATAEGSHASYYGPEFAVNGAGLYLGTFPNQIHHGGHHSGVGNSAEQQWLSQEPGDWYKVDLGALYSLDSVIVWNGSFRGTLVDDSIDQADIYYSTQETDPGSNFADPAWIPLGTPGSRHLVPNPGTGDWGPTETIALGVDAQWFALDVNSNGGHGDWSALGELQFVGELAGGSAVPEPSTFVLAALGLLGLGVVARRRRRKN